MPVSPNRRRSSPASRRGAAKRIADEPVLGGADIGFDLAHPCRGIDQLDIELAAILSEPGLPLGDAGQAGDRDGDEAEGRAALLWQDDISNQGADVAFDHAVI